MITSIKLYIDVGGEEKVDMMRARGVLDDLIGDTPVSHWSPAADLSDYTLETLADNSIV